MNSYPLWVWIGCTMGYINVAVWSIGFFRARGRRRRELEALGLRTGWQNEVFGRPE